MSDIKNEFTWSKSRDSLFLECLRAYYHNHYGSWGGWNSTAPDDLRELYIMKNLGTRAIWKGTIVHDVAERALKALLNDERWTLEEARIQTRKRFDEELQISRQGLYRNGATVKWGNRLIKANGLQEHYYGMPVKEQDWEDLASDILKCLHNFYASPIFHRLNEIAPESILSVEELQSFRVAGIKVWVKIDLCLRGHDKKIVIVDWKTGGAHRAEDIAKQIGIYGLFAQHRFGTSPEGVIGFDVNLNDNSSRKHPIDEAVLKNIEAYIQHSAQAMQEKLSDVSDNTADIRQFPMTNNRKTCLRCRFRRACGKE